jgi:hypothetical protein
VTMRDTPAGRTVRSVTASVWAYAGLIVWSVHFLVVYCSAAVFCAAGIADRLLLGWRPIVVVTAAATLAALLALAVLALRPAGGPPRNAAIDYEADGFLIWQTRAVAAFSAVGVIFVAGAVVVLGGTCR